LKHLGEYIECLNEDPTLLEALRNDPRNTINEARLTKEEKLALWQGDAALVESMIGDQALPIKIREVLESLASEQKG